MEIIERGIVIRARAHRRPADRNRQIERMRAAADVVHLLALDVHAADEHRFRPLEVFPRGGANVLVDEADRPVGREVGRDQQQALRRHESLHAIGQRVGVLERTKRRRVARKDAQDAPCRLDAFSSHQTSSDKASTNLSTTLKAGPEFLQDCGDLRPAAVGSNSHGVQWLHEDRRPATTPQAISREANSGSRPALPASRKSVPARPVRTSQSSNSGARFRPKRSRI